MSRTTTVHCGEPMVWTFAFPKAEWYCLDCGAKFGMFGPATVESTDDIDARKRARTDEFRALVDGLITPAARYKWCPLCERDDHDIHATPDQWEADSAARRRLLDRTLVASPGAS